MAAKPFLHDSRVWKKKSATPHGGCYSCIYAEPMQLIEKDCHFRMRVSLWRIVLLYVAVPAVLSCAAVPATATHSPYGEKCWLIAFHGWFYHKNGLQKVRKPTTNSQIPPFDTGGMEGVVRE